MNKNFRKLSAITLVGATLFSSSCATIFGRSNYNVTIDSNPSKSSITIIDKKGATVYEGIAPATVKLKSSAGYFSKGEYHVKFHLDGYADKTITISSKLNGWYVANIFIGGLVGMLIVDPASGAMYKIDQLNVLESLEQNKTTAQVQQLKIVDINTLPAYAFKHLKKIN